MLAFWDSVTALIYIVDLGKVTSTSFRDSDFGTAFTDALKDFESLAGVRGFSKTPIVLIFTQIKIFKERLHEPHFKDCLPGYTGGPDYADATDFVRKTFVSGASIFNDCRSVYPSFHDDPSTGVFRYIIAAVNDIIISKALETTHPSLKG